MCFFIIWNEHLLFVLWDRVLRFVCSHNLVVSLKQLLPTYPLRLYLPWKTDIGIYVCGVAPLIQKVILNLVLYIRSSVDILPFLLYFCIFFFIYVASRIKMRYSLCGFTLLVGSIKVIIIILVLDSKIVA